LRNTDDRDKQTTALRRILETPALAQVVPQLPPELLHKIIQSYGLEKCGEIVALATPAQLARVFDLDLWKAPRPGVEEQLDAGRFGEWLEVLMDAGPEVAAAKLTAMDTGLVVTALCRHCRVFDRAAQVQSDKHTETFAIGGYVLEATRQDAWATILDLLLHLDATQPEYFRTVMRECVARSNRGYELDGLDDLFSKTDQGAFDLAVDRESRREASGYVAPDQARVFLQMSRELRLDRASPPSASPIATAYFRAIQWTPSAVESDPGAVAVPPETAGAIAEVVDLLTEAGVVTPPARALLTGSTAPLSRLARIEAFLDAAAPSTSDAFVYLANSLLAGCPVQGRPFTQKESTDATLAVCNLGLEQWPAKWDAPADLIAVFQVGWTVLYRDVALASARHLLLALRGFSSGDSETDRSLGELRRALTKQCRNGQPWKAREALEVIMILDTPAWATLTGLIAECPVLPERIGFEFIAGRSQIDAVRHFLTSLPSALSP